MKPISGIDVSDSQPRDIGPLIRQFGAGVVVVKLYLMAEGGLTAKSCSLMQARSALASGALALGYVWGYSSEDPADTATQALDLYRRGGLVGPLVVDLEDYTYRDGRQEPPVGADWLDRFCTIVEASGLKVAVYSRLQWLKDVFPGGLAAFARFAGRVSLWLADYDGDAALRTDIPPGFQLLGKQYAEHPMDLDVFDLDLIGAQPMADHLADADVNEQNQFDPSNYDTRAEYAVISPAACSAASLAAVATDYGHPTNISGALRLIRATGDDVTPDGGLLNRLGAAVALADALDSLGVPSSAHPWDEFTRETFKEVLHGGRPIICQMENYLRRGLGHFLVVDGLLGDGTLGVTVADSNAGSGKRKQYLWNDLWAEMAGGVAVWPDAPRPDPQPVEDDVADQQLADENRHLKDALANLTADRDRLATSLYVLRDTVGGAFQAALNELNRVTVQAVGPKA